jgi:hypothetical protein
MISVTPIDTMEGDKHVVHPAVLVNHLVVRKIETVEIAAPVAVIPKVEAADQEPMAAPPVSAAPPPAPPLLLSLITFMDGKTMHVKEDLATIKPMVG